jgi:hypothetical protein
MVTHPGELITREEIQKELWQDQFVEVDHGINAAIKKIRNALEEDPAHPKFIETLAKKGYRFIAAVEEIYDQRLPDPVAPLTDSVPEPPMSPDVMTESVNPLERSDVGKPFTLGIPVAAARFLLLLIQSGYIAMYCGALINLEALGGALSNAGMEPVSVTLPIVLVTAMCGIAVRIYLFAEVGWAHPAAGRQFRRLFPMLLVLDAMWAASPLLAAGKIGFGLALVGVAGLSYLPFAQRTLMVTITPEDFLPTRRRVSL